MALITEDGILGKVCSSCREWKPLSDYSPGGASHGLSQGGKHCQCRGCNAKAHRIRHRRHTLIIQRAREVDLAS